MEYVIKPEAVYDIDRVLHALRSLCVDKNIRVDRTCGFHVHIGIENLPEKSKKIWASWMVTIAREIEDDVFRAVPESRRDNSYCHRIKNDNSSVIHTRYSSYKGDNNRYKWVNVVEMFRQGGIGTVEIRLLGSTRRYCYLEGWINACLIMGNYALKLMEDPSSLPYYVSELKRHFKSVENFLYHEGISSDLEKATIASNLRKLRQNLLDPNPQQHGIYAEWERRLRRIIQQISPRPTSRRSVYGDHVFSNGETCSNGPRCTNARHMQLWELERSQQEAQMLIAPSVSLAGVV